MGLTGLTEKQWDYWHNANKKWNVKSGATRSGKTFLDYYLMPRRIAAVTGKGSILILGNTRGSIDSNKKYNMQESIPYENAKPMYLVDDVDNQETIKDIVLDTCKGLK